MKSKLRNPMVRAVASAHGVFVARKHGDRSGFRMRPAAPQPDEYLELRRQATVHAWNDRLAIGNTVLPSSFTLKVAR